MDANARATHGRMGQYIVMPDWGTIGIIRLYFVVFRRRTLYILHHHIPVYYT